jgi:hypothetical protein
MSLFNLVQSDLPRYRCMTRLSLSIAAAALMLPGTLSPSQTVNLGDDVSRPIPGAGHDYIHMLSETVNPANGSLNIKIDLPIPKGRGLSLPFAITYNSGEVFHYTSPMAGHAYIDSYLNGGGLTDRSEAGFGWSDTLPYATYSGYTVTWPYIPGNPPHPN